MLCWYHTDSVPAITKLVVDVWPSSGAPGLHTGEGHCGNCTCFQLMPRWERLHMPQSSALLRVQLFRRAYTLYYHAWPYTIVAGQIRSLFVVRICACMLCKATRLYTFVIVPDLGSIGYSMIQDCMHVNTSTRVCGIVFVHKYTMIPT